MSEEQESLLGLAMRTYDQYGVHSEGMQAVVNAITDRLAPYRDSATPAESGALASLHKAVQAARELMNSVDPQNQQQMIMLKASLCNDLIRIIEEKAGGVQSAPAPRERSCRVCGDTVRMKGRLPFEDHCGRPECVPF